MRLFATLLLIPSLSLAGKFDDQQVSLLQPVPPKYKTLAAQAILEFEKAELYPQIEELGAAITQALRAGNVQVVGPEDRAQVRIRVRFTAFVAGSESVITEQQRLEVEVKDNKDATVCRPTDVPVNYHTGNGSLSATVSLDEGSQKLVYSGPVTASYTFKRLRSVNGVPRNPGERNPCSGVFGIASRPYQDAFAAGEAMSPPEIDARVRSDFATAVAATIVKTDRPVRMRLSSDKALQPANQLLVTGQFAQAATAVPTCARGVEKGDCHYTRALTTEAAAYHLFHSNTSIEGARRAQAELVHAVTYYQEAISADRKEKVLLNNDARVRTLLAEWNQFVDYMAWIGSATAPEDLPAVARPPKQPEPAPQPGPLTTDEGAKRLLTAENSWRQLMREELLRRPPSNNEAFLKEKLEEASLFTPPIPESEARRIVADELSAYAVLQKRMSLYKEKVKVFLTNGKLTPDAVDALKNIAANFNIKPELADRLKDEVIKEARRPAPAPAKKKL